MNQIDDYFQSYRFKPIFQCDLIEHCSRQKNQILAYPIKIILDLLKDSFKYQGLFRLNSSKIKMKKYSLEIDLQLTNEIINSNQYHHDPYLLANLLKQYLRELPECLLTNKLYSKWIQIHLIQFRLFFSFFKKKNIFRFFS